MANLYDTKINGTIIVDTAITSGCGFQNMVVLTTGTSATYTLPDAIKIPGAKFKATIIGAGGGGAASYDYTSGGRLPGSGSSGALVIAIITVVEGVYSFTYTIGAGGSGGVVTYVIGDTYSTSAATAGSDTLIRYNSISYISGGGDYGRGLNATSTGFFGGSASAGNGVLNMTGNPGNSWGVVDSSSIQIIRGGSTPLGYGSGGGIPSNSGIGQSGTNYGSGGGAGTYRTAGGNGAAGQPGVIILEY